MKRLQKAVILAELADKMWAHGSWCGETHIQKAVYLLQELFKVPLEYYYLLYKHGPFSFDLRDEITELRIDDLFRLEPRSMPYGPSLRPTKNAEELKGRFPKTLNRYRKRLEYVAEALDGKGVVDLERLATALYVSREIKQGQQKFRAEQICNLKPHITSDSALDAIKQVDAMRQEVKNLVEADHEG
ncbi:MAG: hypothetical protein ACLQPD_31895 [Desulfomonilaceae bacterium]